MQQRFILSQQNHQQRQQYKCKIKYTSLHWQCGVCTSTVALVNVPVVYNTTAFLHRYVSIQLICILIYVANICQLSRCYRSNWNLNWFTFDLKYLIGQYCDFGLWKCEMTMFVMTAVRWWLFWRIEFVYTRLPVLGV